MRLSSVSFHSALAAPRVSYAGQEPDSASAKSEQYDRAARAVVDVMGRKQVPRTLPLFMTVVNQATAQPGGPQPLSYRELATTVLERVMAMPHTMAKRATEHIQKLCAEHDRCVSGRVSSGGKSWTRSRSARRQPMAFRRQSA